MNYEQKLAIAHLVYADIVKVIDKWHQNENPLSIGFFWDNCISVEGEIFEGRFLSENEEKDI